VLIVADDLTGAADTAGAFASAGHRCVVLLGHRTPMWAPESTVVALDTDSRAMSESDAFDVTATAVRAHAGWPVYVKIDSTVRGHVRAIVLAALAARRATVAEPARVVVCPAFPALGRTVVDGTARLDGQPLPGGDLRGLLADVAAATELVVVDAETDADLAALVEAKHDPARPEATLWVGSAGLARHLAERTAAGSRARGSSVRHDRLAAAHVVVVVGSQHERIAVQVARLGADTRVVQIDPRHPTTVEDIMPVLTDADGLVLTGGHTARVVLDALGITTLDVGGEVVTGMPWSTATRTNRRLSIVTKAGGFGDEMALRRAVEFLEHG